MRAISTVRMSRTVIDATTSSRPSFSLTLLRRMSRIGTAGPPSCLGLTHEPALCCCPAPAPAASNHGLSMNYTTDFKSIRAEVSAQEWQARFDLAACYRLIDKYGMTDLIYNHITARIPGSKDHLLINLYGMLYKEITASSLVKIDVEGEIIWKPETDYGINKSGYVIHGAIHKARRDVACVLHTHTRAGIAVSAMK